MTSQVIKLPVNTKIDIRHQITDNDKEVPSLISYQFLSGGISDGNKALKLYGSIDGTNFFLLDSLSHETSEIVTANFPNVPFYYICKGSFATSPAILGTDANTKLGHADNLADGTSSIHFYTEV